MSQFRIKYQKPLVVLGLAVLLALFSLPTALAGEGRTDEVVHIKADEVINDDLFASGREVIIDGVVKGDLMATGQSVTVNGTVEGDLLAAAQAVTINGEVSDDLRTGAMVILINGTVGDDVLVGGFSLENGPESTIGGDLFVGGLQALIEGEIAGDIRGGTGGMKISGNVGGDIDVEVGEDTGGPSPANFMGSIPNIPPLPVVPQGLAIDDNASVAGNVTYRGPARGDVQEAAVSGEVEFIQQEGEAADRGIGFGNWLWDQIQRLLRLLLIGALAVWLAPTFIGAASQKLSERLWPSLGWGVLTPIIVLIGLALLGLISLLVGFPTLVFGTLIFGFLLIFFYLGAIVVGQSLGRWILKKIGPARAGSAMWTTLTGLVVVWLLTVIPILGLIIGFFVALFGVGGLWLAGRERMKGAGVEGPTLEATP
jgi:hypothetical protein